LQELPTEEAIGRLEGQDILCAPVLNLAQALQHPQTVENSTVVETPSGKLIGAPFRMEEGSFAISRGAPYLGEHSASILAAIGYSDDEIRQLLDDGIVEGSQLGDQPSRVAG
jgi:formyl-CoA transferase